MVQLPWTDKPKITVGSETWINPLCAELFEKISKYNGIFSSFLITEMTSSWILSAWLMEPFFSYIYNSMVADDLVLQGAWALEVTPMPRSDALRRNIHIFTKRLTLHRINVHNFFANRSILKSTWKLIKLPDWSSTQNLHTTSTSIWENTNITWKN